jgi:hypothetical protein
MPGLVCGECGDKIRPDDDAVELASNWWVHAECFIEQGD